MYDLYFESFNKKIPLATEEQELIKTYLSVKKIRKKQYLLQAGDPCKIMAFVSKGALRSYTVDDNGVEHIVQFAVEDWFISDSYSFYTGEDATYNIEAIEDSELIIISKSANDELLKHSPKYAAFMMDKITAAYIALQKRLNSINNVNIEDRYQNFLKQYPDIAQRVPQHMIASYLGLTPETLSRIRRRLML